MAAERSDRIHRIAEALGLPDSELFDRADWEREVIQKNIDWALNA